MSSTSNVGKISGTEGFYNEFGFIKANGETSETEEKKWYGINEWNKIYDGESRLVDNKVETTESEYLEALADTPGNGGQVITFNDFTYHPKIHSTFEHNVVSYLYGCSDSPFEFNDEMRQQQNVMSDYYNKDGIKFKKPRSEWSDSIKNKTTLTNSDLTNYVTFVADYTSSGNNTFPDGAISLVGWG